MRCLSGIRAANEVLADVKAGVIVGGVGGVGRVGGAGGGAKWLGCRDATCLRCGAAGAAAVPIPARADVSPVMATLSDYMAAAKDRALPAAIVEHAVHHVLDTVAAMISGAGLPPGRAALTLARAEAGQPVATVVASNTLTGVVDAALVNGVLAHSDETDDSHGPSQSHPGASIVPTALAMGEQLGISGRHYLRAVTLGYDVGTRTDDGARWARVP